MLGCQGLARCGPGGLSGGTGMASDPVLGLHHSLGMGDEELMLFVGRHFPKENIDYEAVLKSNQTPREESSGFQEVKDAFLNPAFEN